MGKRIAYSADGTWQAPTKGTNVYRLYKALTTTADQVTFYDDGVGAEAAGMDRFLDGSFGRGLVEKVLEGYTKIAHVYEAGDEIFLFGFSRGAYTARSLAGMIATCGLPTGRFTDDSVAKVFAAYRDPGHRAEMLAELDGCELADALIRMIGVWDTVGSLGIPAIVGGIDAGRYGFLDTGLHPDVKNAYQALAVDEKRMQFPPTLWTSESVAGQTIEQVWFSGCHGDIGGGTLLGGGVDQQTRLCDIPLGWMAGKARSLGLTMDSDAATRFAVLPARYALDHMRESWSAKAGPPHLRTIGGTARLANSVGVRVQYGLTYMPGNLKIEDGALAARYAVVNVVDEDAI